MLLLYELFKYIDYPVSPLSVLGISGVIILAGDPSMALNAGFQMTYGAVIGILICSKLLRKKSRICQYLIPLGSLLFIIPITAVNFGVVPFLSIPLGVLLSMSLIPFTMLCLFLIIILYALQLTFLATIFLKGLNPLLSLSRLSVDFLANNFGTIALNGVMKSVILIAAFISLIAMTVTILKPQSPV